MDFSLRAVLSCVTAYKNKDYTKMFEIIGYPIPPTQEVFNHLVKLISGARFSASFKGDLEIKYEKGDITKEEYEIFRDMDTTFDFNADFDLVYGAFIHYYGIDLIDTNINYFKFKMLFEYILLDDGNPIINRMRIRDFKPIKGEGDDVMSYNESMAKAKDKYSL